MLNPVPKGNHVLCEFVPFGKIGAIHLPGENDKKPGTETLGRWKIAMKGEGKMLTEGPRAGEIIPIPYDVGDFVFVLPSPRHMRLTEEGQEWMFAGRKLCIFNAEFLIGTANGTPPDKLPTVQKATPQETRQLVK